MKYLKGLLLLTLTLTGCNLMSGIQGTTQEDAIINQFIVNEASPSVGKPISLTIKGDLFNKDYTLNKVAIQVSDELKLVAVRVIADEHNNNKTIELAPFETTSTFKVNGTGSYQIIGTTGEATAGVTVLQ